MADNLDLFDHLQARRFAPPEWIMAREVTIRGYGRKVRDRRVDAVAVNVWGSRGLTIVGFEGKASRADWLRERADPEKADRAIDALDRFYLVAPVGVAHEDEIPATWGFLEQRGDRWYTRRPAPALPREPAATIRLLVSFLKALRRVDDDLLGKVKLESYEQGYAAGQKRSERPHEVALLERQVQDLKRHEIALRAYEEALGASIRHRWTLGDVRARQAGQVVRFLLEGGDRVEQWASALDRVASGARELQQLVLVARDISAASRMEHPDIDSSCGPDEG